MVKKSGKKEIKEVKSPTFSALNLAVILMAAAFIIGTYSSLDIAAVRISNSCGFFCRLDNVMTGNVVETPELRIATSTCMKDVGLGLGSLSSSPGCGCGYDLWHCDTDCASDGKTVRLRVYANCINSCLGGCNAQQCGVTPVGEWQDGWVIPTKYCGNDYNANDVHCNATKSPLNLYVTHYAIGCSSGQCTNTSSGDVFSAACSASKICSGGQCASAAGTTMLGNWPGADIISYNNAYDLRVLTISAWIKTTSAVSQSILDKLDANNVGYEMWMTNGVLKATVSLSSTTSSTISSSKSIRDNNWHHVVMTYDGSYIKLYVDNKLETAQGGATQSYNGGIGFNTEGIVIGSLFVGSIKDVRLYGYALSAAEIDALYSISPVGACPSGGLGDSSIYKCLNSTAAESYIDSSDTQGNMKCCDLTKGKWYEEFTAISENCPAGKNITITATAKTYCEKPLKSLKNVISVCDAQGGEYYDNNTKDCADADKIMIEGFNCCKKNLATWKTCTARVPQGSLCVISSGFICTGTVMYSAESTNPGLQCCSQACTYTGQWKTCSEMGYMGYNISKGEDCRQPVGAKDDTTEMKCCGVAVNTTSVTLSCAGQVKESCSYALGLKCPAGQWIPATDDLKDSIQCCAALCDRKNCADLSSFFTLCDLTASSCEAGNEIQSADSAPGSKQCCRSACKPKISLPTAVTGCGDGTINPAVGEVCDINLAVTRTCSQEKGTGWTGTVRCSADCRSFNYQCTAPQGGGGGAAICAVGNVQVGEGYRTSTQYCSITEQRMVDQLPTDEECGMHYQCESNLCSGGYCTEVRETLALIPRIWCWLQAWITFPVDTENRETRICSCLIPKYIAESDDIPSDYPEHEFC